MKKVRYILLEHELSFYDYCYKEAILEEKERLKSLFKRFIEQHRRSKKTYDRTMVWAVRMILKRSFSWEGYKQYKESLR